MAQCEIRELVNWEAFQNDWEAKQAAVYGPQEIQPRDTASRYEARNRINSLATGKVEPIYAVVATTYRCYGGPEEGGWYYDTTHVDEVRRAWDFLGLLKAVRELRDTHETCRYGLGSVLSSGDTVIYLTRDAEAIERLDTSRQPRPRYE